MPRHVLVFVVLAFSFMPSSTSFAQQVVDDDEAEVVELVESYLASVRYPDPGPLNEDIYATDVHLIHSIGIENRGREEVIEMLEQSRLENATFVEKLEVEFDVDSVQIHGDFAWLSCEMSIRGVLRDGEGEIARDNRSTFIFKKTDNRWQIAYEHSSLKVDQ